MAQEKFWMVWSPGGVNPPKVRHASLAEAKHAAEAMARNNCGQEFYTMEAQSCSVVSGCITTSLEAPPPRYQLTLEEQDCIRYNRAHKNEPLGLVGKGAAIKSVKERLNCSVSEARDIVDKWRKDSGY